MPATLLSEAQMETLIANRADEHGENPPVVRLAWNGYPWEMLIHHIDEDNDTLVGLVQDCMEPAVPGGASLAEMETIHNGTHPDKHLTIAAHEDFDASQPMHRYLYAAEQEGTIPQAPGRYCDVCGVYYPAEDPCIQH